MQLKANDRSNIPDGVYPADMLSIVEREPREDSKNQEKFRYWIFNVFTPDHPEGVEHPATSSMSFAPKSKTYAWFQAALGRPIERNEELDTEEILPLPCQVVIKENSESGFSRIDDVLKAKPGQILGGNGVAL